MSLLRPPFYQVNSDSCNPWKLHPHAAWRCDAANPVRAVAEAKSGVPRLPCAVPATRYD